MKTLYVTLLVTLGASNGSSEGGKATSTGLGEQEIKGTVAGAYLLYIHNIFVKEVKY